MKKKSIEDRFWSKVPSITSTKTCWEWGAGRHERGYGTFRLNGKMLKAHRVAWELTHGEIPDGLWVLHKCDNPACVNPNHLFLGTHQDNVDDKVSKNRQAKQAGEKHPQHKLTLKQVNSIRSQYVPGKVSQEKLARDFGVGQSEISDIINRKRWQ